MTKLFRISLAMVLALTFVVSLLAYSGGPYGPYGELGEWAYEAFYSDNGVAQAPASNPTADDADWNGPVTGHVRTWYVTEGESDDETMETRVIVEIKNSNSEVVDSFDPGWTSSGTADPSASISNANYYASWSLVGPFTPDDYTVWLTVICRGSHEGGSSHYLCGNKLINEFTVNPSEMCP